MQVHRTLQEVIEMSTIEIQRFAADVKSNGALRAEAEKAYALHSQASPVDGLAAFAAAKGYGFTTDELKAHARGDGKAVTDAELDGVAGGRNTFGGFAGMFGSLFGTDPF
jgi:predicted ribosomally synthesized peptide with nif11-like leader